MTDFLLIDGNSVGFASQGAKHKLSINGRETTAIFGFLRTLRVLCDENPGATPIVFWDGRSWRYDHYPEYKGNREKDDNQKSDRAAYKEQRPTISRALSALGVTQKIAANLEADDLIALETWALKGKKATIVSGDRDLLQLVTEDVDWYTPIRLPGGKLPKMIRVTADSFAEDTEYENAAAFVKGKAFLGDVSDNMPGVDGIGKKAAPLVVKTWPDLNEMIGDIRMRGDAAIPPYLSRYKKKLKTFAASEVAQRNFLRNYRLMRLSPSYVPKPVNLKVSSPTYGRNAFKAICEELGFVSILKDLDNFARPFEERSTLSEAA